MIESGEVRGTVQLHGADMDRAAFRLAVGLTSRTSGPYFLAVKAGLLDVMTNAVLSARVPTLGEFEQGALEDEAFDAAEVLRDPCAGPAVTGLAPVRPKEATT